MEFPFGHTHHHHHHQRNDDEEPNRGRDRDFYPPPDTAPPPPYAFDQPPPPHPYGIDNEFYPPPPRPPPPSSHYYQDPNFPPPPPHPQPQPRPYSHQEADYAPPPPPPPPAEVTHVSHGSTETHHYFQPHLPSFLHHHSHESAGGSVSDPALDFSNKPTYKVFCKADPNFHLTIRDGQVVLAPSDPSDNYQNWYKDEKYSTRVKDEEGCPCFSLVNKATGQAMKHSVGDSHPVQLIAYNPDKLDQSILWTESKDLGDGYRAVRMVNNVRLNVDAFHGDEKSGGVHNGTTIVLWQWNKGDNQRWKITPHCKLLVKFIYFFLVCHLES